MIRTSFFAFPLRDPFPPIEVLAEDKPLFDIDNKFQAYRRKIGFSEFIRDIGNSLGSTRRPLTHITIPWYPFLSNKG